MKQDGQNKGILKDGKKSGKETGSHFGRNYKPHTPPPSLWVPYTAG